MPLLLPAPWLPGRRRRPPANKLSRPIAPLLLPADRARRGISLAWASPEWIPIFHPNPCPANCHRCRHHPSRGYARNPMPSAPQPIRLQITNIPARIDIILHCHEKERCCIRSCILVGETFPVDQVSSLRPFMRHFAVGSLPLHEEVQSVARESEISIAVYRINCVKRISPEVPAKPGPCRVA